MARTTSGRPVVVIIAATTGRLGVKVTTYGESIHQGRRLSQPIKLHVTPSYFIESGYCGRQLPRENVDEVVKLNCKNLGASDQMMRSECRYNSALHAFDLHLHEAHGWGGEQVICATDG